MWSQDAERGGVSVRAEGTRGPDGKYEATRGAQRARERGSQPPKADRAGAKAQVGHCAQYNAHRNGHHKWIARHYGRSRAPVSKCFGPHRFALCAFSSRAEVTGTGCPAGGRLRFKSRSPHVRRVPLGKASSV